MLNGRRDFQSVRTVILELDVSEKQVLPRPPTVQSSSKPTFVVTEEPAEDEIEHEDETCTPFFETEFEEDELHAIVVSLDSQDLAEDEIVNMFAKVTSGIRQWREDCKKPIRSKGGRLKEKGAVGASYCFHISSDADQTGCSWASFDEFLNLAELSSVAVPLRDEIPLANVGTLALADTAAGQALVGSPDLERMVRAFKKRGYKIHVNKGETNLPAANGLGGKSTPVGK
ncbi:unnamed protein product, partial [Prorocentrum cordatum]